MPENHGGWDSEDMAKLPTPRETDEILRDHALLRACRTKGLAEIAQEFQLVDEKAAQAAINRALKRLDRRLRDDVDILRAREWARLEEWQDDMAGGAKRVDPKTGEVTGLDHKTAAELRLYSESKRRLYGIDLQRDAPAGPETIVVDVRFPWERGPAGEVVDGEAEEIGSGEEDEDGPDEEAPGAPAPV